MELLPVSERMLLFFLFVPWVMSIASRSVFISKTKIAETRIGCFNEVKMLREIWFRHRGRRCGLEEGSLIKLGSQ